MQEPIEVKTQKANEYLRQIKAAYPQAEAIYEDAIIRICGVDGLMALREMRLIELCGILEGRRLYAV